MIHVCCCAGMGMVGFIGEYTVSQLTVSNDQSHNNQTSVIRKSRNQQSNVNLSENWCR